MARTTRKSKSTSKAKAKTTPRSAGDVARSAWQQAVTAVVDAEQQAETRVRRLLKKNKINGDEAAAVVAKLRARVEKERTAAGKRLNDMVQQTLASLNIPSRREIASLTRTVEQLSRKIDSLQRRRRK